MEGWDMKSKERLVEHNGKLYRWYNSKGYRALHPVVGGKTDYSKTVMEHRLIYETTYDIHLPDNVVIHHINRNRADNRPENLIALSHEDHAKLHQYDDSMKLDCDSKMSRTTGYKPVRTNTAMKLLREKLSSIVAHNDKLYYRRIMPTGYYCLHPISDDGYIDYETQILEHRLVYELGNNVKLDDSVVIHHINHDKTDNRLENLSAMSRSEHLIAHANASGKTVGGWFCIDCGKKISNGAKRCRECHAKSMAANNHEHRVVNGITKDRKQVDRHVLEELIRTKNNTEIAKIYGVSDTSVKKWRKKFGLPSAREQQRHCYRADCSEV